MVRALCTSTLLLLLCITAHAKEIEIVNIRVGQGDATLIQGPPNAQGDRVQVLIDGGDIGEFDGGKIVGAVLSKRGVKKLDYLIVTHYDVDHIGGIVSGPRHGKSFLLGRNGTPGAEGDDDGDGYDGWIRYNWEPDPEEFGLGDDIPVHNFIDRGDEPPGSSQAYEKYKFLAEAKGNRTSLSSQELVDRFEIDLGGGAKLVALAGNGYVRGRSGQVPNVNTENERSLSFLLSYGDFDYLISGDLIGKSHGSENAKLEAEVGKYIEGEGIIVDVLHVNHHGANNGSETGFLNSIKPTIAVISAGNGNPHKHPHIDTLQRLTDAKVYRIIQTAWGTTNKKMPEKVRRAQAIYQNDVIIRSDGEDFTISTSRTYEADKNPLRQ